MGPTRAGSRSTVMIVPVHYHSGMSARQSRQSRDRVRRASHTGQDRTGQVDRLIGAGQDRTGQDRTGQDTQGRTGQDRTGPGSPDHNLGFRAPQRSIYMASIPRPTADRNTLSYNRPTHRDPGAV